MACSRSSRPLQASKADASTSPPQASQSRTKAFGFLDLPPEVRIAFYRILFSGAYLKLYNEGICPRESHASNCQILRTCSTIHAEATPYLYRSLTLIHSLGRKGPDQPALQPEYRKLIECIDITSRWTQEQSITPSILRSFASLKVVKLSVHTVCLDLERPEPEYIGIVPLPLDSAPEPLLALIREKPLLQWYHWERSSCSFGPPELLRILRMKGRSFDVQLVFDVQVGVLNSDVVGSAPWRAGISADHLVKVEVLELDGEFIVSFKPE
jgi:hypothetical protein